MYILGQCSNAWDSFSMILMLIAVELVSAYGARRNFRSQAPACGADPSRNLVPAARLVPAQLQLPRASSLSC